MRIIIGNDTYDIIKSKNLIKRENWANFHSYSLKLKMSKEDYNQFIWFCSKFNNQFNFHWVKEDGIYSCEGNINNSKITSEFPNGDIICILSTSIFKKEKVNKSKSRNIILDEILN